MMLLETFRWNEMEMKGLKTECCWNNFTTLLVRKASQDTTTKRKAIHIIYVFKAVLTVRQSSYSQNVCVAFGPCTAKLTDGNLATGECILKTILLAVPWNLSPTMSCGLNLVRAWKYWRRTLVCCRVHAYACLVSHLACSYWCVIIVIFPFQQPLHLASTLRLDGVRSNNQNNRSIYQSICLL